MKFKQFIENELDQDTIKLLELSYFIDNPMILNEGIEEWGKKLKSALEKFGLHASKENRGLIEIISKSSKNLSKLLWNSFMAVITGKQEYKDKVVEISKTEIKKEDLIDFLLKLDLLTLHLITGPIHMIDALTGWHIGPKVLKNVDDLVDRAKRAIKNLSFIKDKTDDKKIKNKLSQYIENIKLMIFGNKNDI